MKATTSVRCLIVAGCLLVAAGYLAHVTRAETVPPRDSLRTLPMQIGTWTGRNEPDLKPDILAILGVDDYVLRTYYGPSDRAGTGLYIGYYESQRQGDAIHSPKNCLPGSGWQPLEQGRMTLDVAPSSGAATIPIEVNRVVIGKGLDRQLVLYWYQSNRRVVASEYWGKVFTVLDAVRYNRTDAALVRIIAPLPYDSPSSGAEKRAVSFAQSLFPLLGRYVPR